MMTAKMEKFCQEYCVDLNATQAAIRAGYSADSAGSIGHENLTKPEIQTRISELQNEQAAASKVTKDRIVQELARMAFYDAGSFYDADGNLIPITSLTPEQTRAIVAMEVEQETDYDEKQDKTLITYLKKIKLGDKNRAMDSLCRILGYDAPKKIDPEGILLPTVPPAINIYNTAPPLASSEDQIRDEKPGSAAQTPHTETPPGTEEPGQIS